MRSRAVVVAVLCALVGCTGKNGGDQPAVIASGEFAGTGMDYAANHVLMRERHVGLATSCAVLNPGQLLRTTPPSYRTADVGKPGVPSPKPSDLRMLRRIQRYVHSPTLRYVYAAKRFLVYDAIDGPCMGGAPGYFVLNGSCNEFYMPSNQTDYTVATPGCFSPPRPWIAHDRGQGDPKSWSQPGYHQ